MFSFQLATEKAQADLAEAISPFMNATPMQPAQPIGQQPIAPMPSPEGAALLAQPRAPMAQTLLAQRMPQMPLAQGMAPPASPAFSVQPQQAPQRFAIGGLATSLREDPESHDRDQDFVDTRDQQLMGLVKPPMSMARGGLAVYKEG